jgi:hypothetical protein
MCFCMSFIVPLRDSCGDQAAYLSNLFALAPTHSSALEGVGVGFSDMANGWQANNAVGEADVG